jgi:hypothetical protein
MTKTAIKGSVSFLKPHISYRLGIYDNIPEDDTTNSSCSSNAGSSSSSSSSQFPTFDSLLELSALLLGQSGSMLSAAAEVWSSVNKVCHSFLHDSC